MSLSERLTEDMKTAMKEQDKFKLTVIRTARAAVKNVEIDTRKELSDAEIIDIINREIKMRRDSLQEFEGAGRTDLSEPLRTEIEILLAYVPTQLTEAELEEVVLATIAEAGATSKAEMGKVMGLLVPKIKGIGDSRLANQLVQKHLS